jgi:hypothetical protein
MVYIVGNVMTVLNKGIGKDVEEMVVAYLKGDILLQSLVGENVVHREEPVRSIGLQTEIRSSA